MGLVGSLKTGMTQICVSCSRKVMKEQLQITGPYTNMYTMQSSGAHSFASNLVTHLDSHKLFYDLQHGFRSKRSCETHW